MKRIHFFPCFILVLLLTVNMYSQSHSLPMENAVWTYTIEGDGIIWFTQSISPDSIVIVNNKEYAIIHDVKLEAPPVRNWDYIMYREENKQVFILPQDSTEEILIYDFNLEVGDEFIAKWGANMETDSIIYNVISIDSVIGINDNYFRAFQLNDGQSHGTRWIEGIGDVSWPFIFPHHQGGASVSQFYTLHCFQIDDEFLFGYDNCSLVSNLKEIHNEKIKIYPNPAVEKIHIDSESMLKKVSLIDIYGRSVKQVYPNQNFLTINCEEIGSGIYFLISENNFNEIYTQRIIIN